MSNLVQIGTLPLDTEIIIKRTRENNMRLSKIDITGTIPFNVCVVGKFYTSDVCIGWNFVDTVYSALVADAVKVWKSNTDKYNMSKNINMYKYYAWVSSNYIVQLVESLIISANQTCMGCSLPAPHCKANMPDNKFQCISCKVLLDIGG